MNKIDFFNSTSIKMSEYQVNKDKIDRYRMVESIVMCLFMVLIVSWYYYIRLKNE